jgi:hypothetical protein
VAVRVAVLLVLVVKSMVEEETAAVMMAAVLGAGVRAAGMVARRSRHFPNRLSHYPDRTAAMAVVAMVEVIVVRRSRLYQD